MADLLATIVAGTRRSVEVRQARNPARALEKRATRTPARAGSLLAALNRTDRINVIAECKRRSPSRGVLRARYDPVTLARGYAAAGAAAISVLTEPTFFDGALEHLEAIRGAVDLPLLRKDFIVSDYQLLEAKAAGADAVLIIVAALEAAEVRALTARASSLGLDAVVEVHDATELAVAIDAGARIVGVNNRSLRTLEVDTDASERLIARMPSGVVAVSESGLRSAADLIRLRALGYHAFLIGERFMTEEDPGLELRRLLEGCGNTKDTKDTKDTKVT